MAAVPVGGGWVQESRYSNSCSIELEIMILLSPPSTRRLPKVTARTNSTEDIYTHVCDSVPCEKQHILILSLKAWEVEP